MKSAKKNKVVVRLLGHNLPLLTDQEPESVQRVARYVDRKMQETMVSTHASDTAVAMLTAVTLADELIRAHDENTRLKKELMSMHLEKKD